MNRNLITQLGDACGGLVAVDEDIAFHWSLQWARILVQTNGRKVSEILQAMEG